MNEPLKGQPAQAALAGAGYIVEDAAWMRLARLLRHRMPLLLSVFATTVLAIVATTVLTPKTYTTSVQLMMGNPSAGQPGRDADTTLPLLNSLLSMKGQESAETYADLIQQYQVAQRVIDNLKLSTSPKALLASISVKPVTNTSILQVSATARSAQQSADIANEFARVFVARERELVAAQADDALRFISTQLPEAESRMLRSQRKVSEFESTHRIPDITVATQKALETASGIDAKIAQAQIDQKQAEAQYTAVESELGTVPQTINSGTGVSPNPVLSQLQAQREQAAINLKTALEHYTEQHPSVVAARQQVAELDSEIARTPATIVSSSNTAPNPLYLRLQEQATTSQNAAGQARAQIGVLQQQQTVMNKTLHQLPGETSTLAGLRRDAKLTEDVYSELQRRLTEANVAKSTALSDVSIVAAALPENSSKHPSLVFNLGIALLLGVVLGGTVTLAVDFFDSTLKDEEHVTSVLRLPVLANVPAFGTDATGGKHALGASPATAIPAMSLAALPGGGGAKLSRSEMKRGGVQSLAHQLTIEAFLQLVTSMRYASDKPLRTVAFTSAMAGDGKSTVALNAAVALAELQPRILLIDADMRRPTVHTRLQMPRSPGLSDYLAETAKSDLIIKPTLHAGLDVITAGSKTPNPIKLLQSERLNWLLNDYMNFYSTIMIDCTAMNLVLDAAIIAERVDGTVLVVSAGKSDIRQTKRAISRLASVGVNSLLGVVVNRARTAGTYGGGYYDAEDGAGLASGTGA